MIRELVQEEIRKNLTEAPLPVDWDKGKFSPRTTFKDMVAYAKERASQLGVGSGGRELKSSLSVFLHK